MVDAERAGQGDEGGVLTLLCVKCGHEYYFSEGPPPAGISCEKCVNGVFREFFTPRAGDEAAEDFEETTARDLATDDAEGDTLPGDLLDLNRD